MREIASLGTLSDRITSQARIALRVADSA